MTAAAEAACAEVAFRETMGYSINRLFPGVSSHNNALNRFRDVPEPLRGKWFTQVVASRVSPVEIEFRTPGKLFVLVEVGWWGSPPTVERLAEIGRREPLPRLTTDGLAFDVFSVSGAAGDRMVLPSQAMLVADGLSRLEDDRPANAANARILVIAARPGSGAFSMFFHTLALLRHAEIAGMVPLVYFNRQVCYWNDAGFEGARNAWEYFFQPVSTLTLERLGIDERSLEALDTSGLQAAFGDRAVVRDDYLAADVGFAGWIDDRQRMIAADLVERYVRIRPQLIARADDFDRRHLRGRFVIGVHYRGTDKVYEVAPVPFERYRREIDRHIAAVPDARIFVATDCAHFLDCLAAQYGDRVFSTSARRSSDGQPTHWGYAAGGAEVIVDALLLSRASHFLHGVSNVSAAVLVFNRDLPHTDLTA